MPEYKKIFDGNLDIQTLMVNYPLPLGRLFKKSKVM